jgi:hypothetical protein
VAHSLVIIGYHRQKSQRNYEDLGGDYFDRIDSDGLKAILRQTTRETRAQVIWRRWGLKLAERGGENAKKRAVVAVARKLAVLLHRLWVSGEVYEPLRNSQKAMRAVA